MRATWALDSRELGELRTESAMKPVTDSNLCPRAPTHIPAVRHGKRLVLDDRECRAEREILRCWLRRTDNGADSGGRQVRIRLSS